VFAIRGSVPDKSMCERDKVLAPTRPPANEEEPALNSDRLPEDQKATKGGIIKRGGLHQHRVLENQLLARYSSKAFHRVLSTEKKSKSDPLRKKKSLLQRATENENETSSKKKPMPCRKADP